MSGQRFEELDWISGTNQAGLEDGRVEAAKAPARGSVAAGIVNRFLEGGAVDVEARARCAGFRQLNDDVADTIALAGPHTPAIEAAGGDVFTEGSIEQRESSHGQFFDGFGSD